MRWEDIPGLLSRELGRSPPRGLEVRSVARGAGPTPQLVMIVEPDHGPAEPAQTWRLIYDVPLEDLHVLGPTAFVATVRANLEEWWDTRPAGPVHVVAERID